jgi:hypothetical protein
VLVLQAAFSGLLVIMLAIGPKVRRFTSCQGRWVFLRAIKIRSTTSFRGEVKPAVPCRKFLRHVKNPYSSRQVSPALLCVYVTTE